MHKLGDGPYLYSYEITSYNVSGTANLGFTTIVNTTVTPNVTYPFKSSQVRNPSGKMMVVEPTASHAVNDWPPIEQALGATWVVQCGRWQPFGNSTITAVNNFLTYRHSKNSNSTFADGHGQIVGQNYATNSIYSNPTHVSGLARR